MKQTLLFLSAIFLSQILLSQIKPISRTDYEYDYDIDDLVYRNHLDFSYDGNKITEQVRYIDYSGFKLYDEKNEFTYTGDKQLQQTTSYYSLEDIKWDLYKTKNYYYNLGGSFPDSISDVYADESDYNTAISLNNSTYGPIESLKYFESDNIYEADDSTFYSYQNGLLTEKRIITEHGAFSYSTNYNYDTQGRIKQETSLSGSSFTRNIYSYDNSGNLILEMTYTSPDSSRNTLNWDIYAKKEYKYDLSKTIANISHDYGDVLGQIEMANAITEMEQSYYEDGTYIPDIKYVFNYDITTNTDDFTENDIKIYPNPASNYLILEGSKDADISIISSDGTKLKTATLNGNTLNISELNRGVYFLKIESTNNKIVKKFIVE